jgi:hypothetical protein
MIIGSGLMEELRSNLIYSQSVMTWEQNEVPMKSRGTISSTKCSQELYPIHVEETPLIQAAENGKIKTLDSDYSPVDIAEHIAKLHILTTTEEEVMYWSLNDYPILFSGGLGQAKVRSIHL